MSSHTLIHKSDRFTLTHHNTKKTGSYYRIDISLKHRQWTDESKLKEYDTIFDNAYRTKNSWFYNNEEQANMKYTWAVLRWNNDA